MTVDLTKSTFTAEEAAELEQMGYVMADVTAMGESEAVFAIVGTEDDEQHSEPSFFPKPSWIAAGTVHPAVHMSITLPDGVYALPSSNKEKKEPSW